MLLRHPWLRPAAGCLAGLALGMATGVHAFELRIERPVLRVERAASGRLDLDLDVDRIAVAAAAEAVETGRHPLRLVDGEIRIEESPASRRASAATERCRFAGIQGQGYYAERALAIESLRLESFGGSWQASGRIAFVDKAFDLAVRTEKTALGQLVTAIAGRPPGTELGSLSGRTRLRGSWASGSGWWKRMAGDGSLRIENASLPRFALFEAIFQSVAARVPVLRLARFERGEAVPTQLRSLTQSFVLRAGRLHTEDAKLETDDYRAEGRGSLGFDGSLDYDTRVRLTGPGLKKMLSMARIPVPLGAAPERVPIPVRIGGELGELRFRPDASRVPLSTLLRLVAAGGRGALGKGVGAVREGMGRVLRPRGEESP